MPTRTPIFSRAVAVATPSSSRLSRLKGRQDTRFQSGRGQDQPSAIDANGSGAGSASFKFIGTAAFHDIAGELRFLQKSGDTLVQGDVNGDGTADFTITIDALVTLKGTDFIL